MPGLDGGAGDSYTGGADDAGTDDSYDPGRDPTPIPDNDPEPSAGGGLDGGAGDSYTGGADDYDDDDGGSAPSTPAGPGLDPGTGGGGGGGSDPAPEPETTRLDQLAQRYTDTVAEPVGEAVGDTTPAAQIEQATLGTNRLERTFASAGETIAQAGNLPGIAAGARDTAQTLDQATSTAYDPVTIGGVPTGVRVPDPEGQQEIGRDAAAAGAGAAASAANNPFETAGTAIGAAALGVGGSRVASQVSRRSSGSAASAGGSSGSSGSVLDDITGFADDTRAQTQFGRQRSRGGDSSSSTQIDADDIKSRSVDPDQGPSAYPDPSGRFQGGAGYNRNNPTRGNADYNPSAVEPSGSGSGLGYRSVAQEVQTAQRVPDAGSPLGPDLRSVAGTPSAAGGSAGSGSTASGLGTLAGVNDPTGITDTDTFGGVAGSGGRLDAANDPTGIADTTTRAEPEGTGVGGSGTGAGGTGVTGDLSDINDPTDITGGTTPGGDNDVTGITPSGETGTGGDLAPLGDVRATTQVGTQDRTGVMAQPAFDQQALTEPTAATEVTTDTFGGVTPGFSFGGGTSRPPRREEPDEEAEDEPLPFALGADADEFGSGIASGDALADDLLQ